MATSGTSPSVRKRRIVIWSVGAAIMATVGVHSFIYWKTGAIDPCRAAALRIAKPSQPGGHGLGFTHIGSHTALILPGGEVEMTTLALRSNGVHACYLAALTGEAPGVLEQYP